MIQNTVNYSAVDQLHFDLDPDPFFEITDLDTDPTRPSKKIQLFSSFFSIKNIIPTHNYFFVVVIYEHIFHVYSTKK